MPVLLPGAFEVSQVFDQAAAVVAVAAGIALVLLLPLYFSQKRDLSRLVAWMEREPDHPAGDAAASEAILDRAEAELESIVGVPEPEPSAPVAQPAPATDPASGQLTAAQRVTSERPALERITMEREALIPHPRWRRFRARVLQPRWLIAIAVVAVLAGVGAIVGYELLESGNPERTPRGGAIDPAEVSVAVLNGTTVEGLGGKVGDDVEANGYELGVVSTIPDAVDQTLVMFEKGEEREARRVARDLGVAPVQPIDGQVQALAEGADVVVIAGQDRASA